MIKKVLIANRAEIACRIIRTCKKMGIASVAVYSDADKNSLHTQMANEAFYIGATTAGESYLNTEKIVEIAKQAHVDAVHPGYGFLSENTTFVKQLEKEGIIFIGPSSQAIADMGEKTKSKQILEKANIPILAGYHGNNQNNSFLLEQASKIGYPVLIKASAGGGGKGMKIVNNEEEFLEALASAKREAKSAFGNDHVLIEKYLIDPRHVEVQIIADKHGNCVSLADRDCSIQRRQQKIIEEAPAPNLSQKTKDAMAKTAIKIAKSIKYYNAGTIEFLVDSSENFYFMEMNTRLQVEHPVTEMITGIDLVEWQIKIAAGEKLPLSQNEIKITGHSIETRIYAEDTENNFLPASGKIHMLKWPKIEKATDTRIETGIKTGDDITPFYDPMIAKLVVHADNRQNACNKMLELLKSTYIVGVKNNINFLKKIIKNSNFTGNDPQNLSTQFIDRFKAELFTADKIDDYMYLLAAIGLFKEDLQVTTTNLPKQLIGWRANDIKNISRKYKLDNRLLKARATTNKIYISIDDGEEFAIDYPKELCVGAFSCVISGKEYVSSIYMHNDKLYLFIKDIAHVTFETENPSKNLNSNNDNSGTIFAPMTGRVISVNVKEKENIKAGQTLIIMEAMKMEHTITAPTAGIITNLNTCLNQQVNEGDIIIEIEKTA